MQVNNVELIKKFRYFQDELNTGSVMRMPSTAFLVDHNPIYSGYEAPTGCPPKKVYHNKCFTEFNSFRVGFFGSILI